MVISTIVWFVWTVDDGREIEVIAGVRAAAAAAAAAAAGFTPSESTSKSSSSVLFEVIEDVDRLPIMTPLYAISYLLATICL